MRVIAGKNWPSGLAFEIIDHSRPIAADRWYVKVVGNLRWPVRPEYYAGLASGDPKLDGLIRQKLGERLEYQLVRERNFIDATAKDELIGQLAAQLSTIVDRYLDDETFPVRLFARKYREVGDLCGWERAGAEQASGDDHEPADFSHCFK